MRVDLLYVRLEFGGKWARVSALVPVESRPKLVPLGRGASWGGYEFLIANAGGGV